jgi:hypothetical protein
MAMIIVEAARAVTGGIDTHGEVRVAAGLDGVAVYSAPMHRATEVEFRVLSGELPMFPAKAIHGDEDLGNSVQGAPIRPQLRHNVLLPRTVGGGDTVQATEPLAQGGRLGFTFAQGA